MSYKAFSPDPLFCGSQKMDRLFFGFHRIGPVEQTLSSTTFWANKFFMGTAGRKPGIPTVTGFTRIRF
jgi:hypothetical protein